MKPKKLFHPKEYIKLLEFCMFTTNIGEKAESIIRSIYRRYICDENISPRQYEVLHNISVMCAEAERGQTILKTLKFDGLSEGLPAFAMNEDGSLRLAKEKIIKPTEKEIENVSTDTGLRIDDAGISDLSYSNSDTVDSGRTIVSVLPKEIESCGIKFDGSSDGSASGLN